MYQKNYLLWLDASMMNPHLPMMNGYFEYGVHQAFTLAMLLHSGGDNPPLTQIDEFWEYLAGDIRNWATQSSAVFMPSHAIDSLIERVNRSVKAIAGYFLTQIFPILPKDDTVDVHLSHYNPNLHYVVLSIIEHRN